MDFTKFVDLIDTATLFFCRSDLFSDPFEGSYTHPTVLDAEALLRDTNGLLGDVEKQIAESAARSKNYRKQVAINCWHMNEFESAAMWKLYLDGGNGVAIKTTRNNLTAACSTSEHGVWSVPVKYIDYARDKVPVPTFMAPFRYKRKSFEHERELRAMVFSDTEIESGLAIPVDVDVLIDEVYVSPSSPKWFASLVSRVCAKYEIDRTVKHSSLDEDLPRFI